MLSQAPLDILQRLQSLDFRTFSVGHWAGVFIEQTDFWLSQTAVTPILSRI
jgi:hypothetical protein